MAVCTPLCHIFDDNRTESEYCQTVKHMFAIEYLQQIVGRLQKWDVTFIPTCTQPVNHNQKTVHLEIYRKDIVAPSWNLMGAV